MSGLKTRKGNLTYIKVSKGRFFLSSDKELETPYDELEGKVVDIGIRKDEYNGKTIEKVFIVLEGEDGDRYGVYFPLDSYLTSSMMSYIRGVDFSKPITLHPKQEEKVKQNGETTTRQQFLISQEGRFMKGYHTKETPNGLPAMKQVTLNGAIVWDKTDILNFYKETINKVLKAQIMGSEYQQPKEAVSEPTVAKKFTAKTPPKVELPSVANSADDDDDDLPF